MNGDTFSAAGLTSSLDKNDVAILDASRAMLSAIDMLGSQKCMSGEGALEIQLYDSWSRSMPLLRSI